MSLVSANVRDGLDQNAILNLYCCSFHFCKNLTEISAEYDRQDLSIRENISILIPYLYQCSVHNIKVGFVCVGFFIISVLESHVRKVSIGPHLMQKETWNEA